MRAAFMAIVIAVSSPAFASQGETPAPQTGAQTSQQPAPAKAEDPADKKICRRIDATESRLGSKKVCLTAEQWKRRDQENESAW
jgi:hypothetical protein